MTIRGKHRKAWIVFFLFAFIFVLGYGYYFLNTAFPKKIRVTLDESGYVNLHIPVAGTVSSEDAEVALYDDAQKIPCEKVSANSTFQINAQKTGTYEIVYRLFGLFEFQKIEVDVIEPQSLIPGGMDAGLYLETDGVMVVGITPLEDENGQERIPAKGILDEGDYICTVNGNNIDSKEDLIKYVQNSDGEELLLTVRKDDTLVSESIVPVRVSEDDYKLGIWVRDDCQGIGTITYVDEDGYFGTLGHSISDSDTGLTVDSHEGELRDSSIYSIIKGTSGSPGSVCGVINYNDGSLLGSIFANCDQGVFGQLSEKGLSKIKEVYEKSGMSCEALPVGYQQEVTVGNAYVRSSVSGKLLDYEIEITALDMSSDNKNKGIVLKITDERLLDLTGGIIQGMSGSPIIQNGKIIGAVTHVFVQDSSKGYGIFIEKMLEAEEAAKGY